MSSWPAVVAIGATLVILAVVLENRRVRARSDRHFVHLLETLDEHLRRISADVVRGVERASRTREGLVSDLRLTVDLDDLLERLLDASVRLTAAQAAVIRVDGGEGEPHRRSIGLVDESVDAMLPSNPSATQYTTMLVDWTYRDDERSPGAYRSGAAVPIVEGGVVTGVLATYALPQHAFTADHLSALHELAAQASPQLHNARLFADVARRTIFDPKTGIRNRAGYELELDREVARAQRTGRSLSLVLLGVSADESERNTASADRELVVRDMAAVLTRVARGTDVLCRRDATQFAALLPETDRTGASRFCERVRAAAATNALSHVGPLSLASQIVEWGPDETGGSLDARAAQSLLSLDLGPVDAGDGNGKRRAGGSPMRTRAADLRAGRESRGEDALLRLLGAEVPRARASAHPLTLLLIDADDVRSVIDRLGGAPGEAILADLEVRVAQQLEGRGSSARIGANQFAAVVRDASSSEAERLVRALEESADPSAGADGAQVRLSAGITDLTQRDTAESVLRRARHALRQARQAGIGTIVVAHSERSNPV